MKLIGIDYGKRRIGMAATDESGQFIRSLPTIDRKTTSDFMGDIQNIIVEENPTSVVIGLPLDKNDNDTVMSREIKVFASKLTGLISIPIHYIDESLTSVRANDIIRNKKKKQRQVKGNIDRIAACLILDAYVKQNQGATDSLLLL